MEQEEIKKKLVEEIAKTESQMLSYRELTKPIAPAVAIGRVSRMDAINNKSAMEMALRQAETKLTNLKTVFSNLDSPEFGICLKCKKSNSPWTHSHTTRK